MRVCVCVSVSARAKAAIPDLAQTARFNGPTFPTASANHQVGRRWGYELSHMHKVPPTHHGSCVCVCVCSHGGTQHSRQDPGCCYAYLAILGGSACLPVLSSCCYLAVCPSFFGLTCPLSVHLHTPSTLPPERNTSGAKGTALNSALERFGPKRGKESKTE